MVDASAIGVGSVLVQVDDQGQMQFVCSNSRIFTKKEQIIAVIDREFYCHCFCKRNFGIFDKCLETPQYIFEGSQTNLQPICGERQYEPPAFQIPNCFHTLSKSCCFLDSDKNFA